MFFNLFGKREGPKPSLDRLQSECKSLLIMSDSVVEDMEDVTERVRQEAKREVDRHNAKIEQLNGEEHDAVCAKIKALEVKEVLMQLVDA
jgi:hypothetical protein